MYVCLQTIFNTCVCRPIVNATIGGANNFLGLRGIFVLGLLKVAGKKALNLPFGAGLVACVAVCGGH